MRTNVVDFRSFAVTRRAFILAVGAASASLFTAIADELARLFRWCSFDAAQMGA